MTSSGRRQHAAALLAVAAALAHLMLTVPSAHSAEMGSPSYGDPVKYTVKPGDSLSGIAAAFGVSEAAIQEANSLKDPNSIQAGTVLTIPGDTPAPPADVKYTVRAGDSLASIAEVHGVTVSAIQEANSLKDPNLIRVGMVLTIPAAGRSAPASTPTPTAVSPPAADVKYTVKAGDTLGTIAVSFGIKASAIQAANGLQDANAIKVGQVLTIPGAVLPPAATPTPQATPSPTATPAKTAAPPSPTPAATSVAQTAPTPRGDPRFFEQTGFRIDNDKFYEYFLRRGGVRTFGYPISKEFLLLGFRVQFFQRLVMQLRPDGTVTTMNLLDDGVMPFTRINFSTFPAPDGGMAGAAPKPGSEGYMEKLLDFVKERSPNQWNELPVNFYKTFCETVKYEDAYPDRKMDPGIMPAINLELWGAPISPPAYDPNNKDFVYLRFQRGIMHYDKTTGATQGLLLGDYLKSIMTGFSLPPDLAEQAKGSRFYMQYSPGAPASLARPAQLPNTDLTGAFTRDGLIAIDPGHGGTEVGAAHIYPDGFALQEKHLNLKIAQKVADVLRRAGRQVLLTRTSDSQINNPPKDVTGDGKMTLDDDLQARVDIANNAGAQVFVSIHFNGSGDPKQNGAEVYYNAKRPFSDKNKKLAQSVLDGILGSTKAAGFNLASRGVKNDETAVGKGNSLYLLGPTDEDKPRATQMAGVLGEAAFLTNDRDAEWIRQEKFQDAIAQGYAQGIIQYLASTGR